MKMKTTAWSFAESRPKQVSYLKGAAIPMKHTEALCEDILILSALADGEVVIEA